jgi:hypothetical protein
MTLERRRFPRIEILNRIHGHVTAFDVFVTVRDISLGGMSVETAFPFPEGALHEFRLTMGQQAQAVVQGRVLRSREHVRGDGGRVYISGIEFVEQVPPGVIAEMIEKIK